MVTRTRLAALAGSAAAGSAIAVGTVARLRRRARLRAAGRGFVEDVMPSILEPTRSADGLDEAHAPGHRHLVRRRAVNDGAGTLPVGTRPFAKHRHGLRHPGRG